MRQKNLNRILFYSVILTLVNIYPFICKCSAQTEKPGDNLPQKTSVELPLEETPGGIKFNGWLAAFNTGDREKLKQFIAANFAAPPNQALPADELTDRQFGFYNGTQGFTLRKMTLSPRANINALLQAKETSYWMMIGLSVTPEADHKIMGMGFRNIEAPPEFLPKGKLGEAELKKNIDALINRLIAADNFSGVIMVAKDGRSIYQRAVGLANRPFNVSNQIDTKFNTASIGKMFTAVTVAQLVEQGKLSFDDTLSKILPEYPNKEIAEKITVRHLLTHTSGINEANGGNGIIRRDRRTIKEYLPAKPGDTLKFEPGTKLDYSNYGYLLLGAVIEKVSGEDYYTYVREHIFKPVGMTNTDNFELDTEPVNLATGYMDAPNGPRHSNTFVLGVRGLPYGGGYSTAEDLVKFNRALLSHKLITAATLETMWTGNLDYTEPDSKYGYGFIVKKYNGTRIIGHGGGWFGVTNKFDMYPDLGYTVVILNNIDSDPNAIAFKLREWLTQQ